MSNLEIYNAVRKVPREAQKTIGGGRLKGMTDISPMWRIKILTELFGPCGVGWKYVITDKRIVEGHAGTMAAFVDIDLFVRHDNQWSEAIAGTGGSMFVAKEREGLYTDDEAYKKALTDAISVACKALGVGADVYWDKDSTKYTKPTEKAETKAADPEEWPKDNEIFIGPQQKKHLASLLDFKKINIKKIFDTYHLRSLDRMTFEDYQKAVAWLESQ